jgi:hypothetical protein
MALPTIRTEITEAIGAHGAWKTRLKAAALAGATAIDPRQVADCHACRFGQWLDAHLSANPEDRAARRIFDLHQRFHRAAGEVAEAICAGHGDQAVRDVETGPFKGASDALVAAMMDWRRKV